MTAYGSARAHICQRKMATCTEAMQGSHPFPRPASWQLARRAAHAAATVKDPWINARSALRRRAPAKLRSHTVIAVGRPRAPSSRGREWPSKFAGRRQGRAQEEERGAGAAGGGDKSMCTPVRIKDGSALRRDRSASCAGTRRAAAGALGPKWEEREGRGVRDVAKMHTGPIGVGDRPGLVREGSRATGAVSAHAHWTDNVELAVGRLSSSAPVHM